MLPVHNRIRKTQRFVDRLLEQSFSDYRLLLLDDASIDGTAEMVKSALNQTVIIRNTGQINWWWSGAMEHGYQWLKKRENEILNDIVLLINDDVVFEKDYLFKGYHLVKATDKTLILSACYDLETNQPLDLGGYVDWERLKLYQSVQHIEPAQQINCLSGRGLWIKAKDFMELGGFYPERLPHYRADFEFSIRAHYRGFHLYCSDEIKVWTHQEPSGFWGFKGRNCLERLRSYFSQKNYSNPLTRIHFIQLACPDRRLRIRQYYYVFKDSLAEFCKTFFTRINCL